jgi:hypothetical protein
MCLLENIYRVYKVSALGLLQRPPMDCCISAMLCCCAICASLAFWSISPTRCWDSRYLATHRSVQDISPRERSGSRCFRDAHLLKHEDAILLKRSFESKDGIDTVSRIVMESASMVRHTIVCGGAVLYSQCTFPFPSWPQKLDRDLVAVADRLQKSSW